MRTLEPVTVDEARAAKARIAGAAIRTPLVRLHTDAVPGELHLKLETLQPIGSFKVRGAANAVGAADAALLRDGVYTASAGNMAQGIGWAARARGIPFSVVVPDSAPQTKLDAITRLGGRIVKVPYAEWWQTFVEHGRAGMTGLFVHPVADRMVMAGNATIALEILEDLPDVDTVYIPFGGGGLSCGIAAVLHALRPGIRVIPCEVDTAAPLAASQRAGRAMAVERKPSFVDGIGGGSVLDEMWPLAQALLDTAAVVSVEQIGAAIKVLAERVRVVAEGAGAASVAAVLDGRRTGGKAVCVVSGGNIDSAVLAGMLRPAPA